MDGTRAPCPHVNLLWTGGWDSTFRLLQLLLKERVSVVPHYLRDPTRASTDTELATMDRIRARIGELHPEAHALLQPTRVAAVDALAQEPEMADALREVRRRVYIGSQYAWLPAYCRQHGIDDMELGVHVDDKVQALLRGYVEPFRHPAGYRSLRVSPAHAGIPEHTLFRWFGLPLFEVDKVSIQQQAEAEGWTETMEMTWFCHSPVHGRPCGLCAPCVYTIEEGLARRIPPSRRALSFLYRRFALPLKAPLRQVRAALR